MLHRFLITPGPASAHAPALGRGRTALALAGLCVVACGGADPLERFDIRLALDNQGEDRSCDEAITCADFELLCDATVGIWIRELPGATAGADAGLAPLIASQCVQVPGRGGQTLCALSTIAVEFENVPRRRGAIEIAVWPTGEIDGSLTECPELAFNSAGRVRTPSAAPVPAFARRAFFDFGGDDPVATVALACEDPDGVRADSCLPRETAVRAQVSDLDLLFSVNLAQARNLNASVGQVTPAAQPGRFEISQAETTRLLLESGPDMTAPVFTATIGNLLDPSDDVCLILLDQVNPTPRSTVTCAPVTDPPPREVDLFGYMLANDDLDKMLAAAGLDGVPDAGIVVGRVISGVAPLEGATVSSSLGATGLFYLNDDLSSAAGLTATSASGYFVATGVPYPSEWTASRRGYKGPAPAPRGGVLDQRITVLVVQLSAEP
jgi:hypothetical protein